MAIADLRASVIVPTRDRHALLAHALRGVLAQDFPRDLYEVIVVDDGSSVPVRVDGDVRLLRHDVSRGVNAARNTGIRAATGALICLLDDDLAVPAGWLRAFVAAAERHPDAACFGGRIRLQLERALPRLCARHGPAHVGSFQLELGSEERAVDAMVSGGNMAIHSQVFARVGDFPEEQPIYFDEYAWQRKARASGAGATVYVPEAWVWHRRTADDLRWRSIVRRRYRFGVGEAVYRGGYSTRELTRHVVGIAGLLWHSVQHRCWAGAAIAASEVGAVVGTLRVRRRG
jgi:GT2 family glycosyltransferase